MEEKLLLFLLQTGGAGRSGESPDIFQELPQERDWTSLKSQSPAAQLGTQTSHTQVRSSVEASLGSGLPNFLVRLAL